MPIQRIEKGLYQLPGDNMFVVASKESLIIEYFIEINGEVNLRDALSDTLFKIDDSTYYGKKFNVFLKNSKLFLDLEPDDKEMYPRQLSRVDSIGMKKWNIFHNKYLLYKIKPEYMSAKNRAEKQIQKRAIQSAYFGLYNWVNKSRESFLIKINEFIAIYITPKIDK
jgi:hypothetical protein